MSNFDDGRYMGKLNSATMTEGRGGKPVLELGWVLLDEGCERAEVISRHYFTGGAKSITVETMIALGWNESDDLISMLGKECVVVASTSDDYGQQWKPQTMSNRPMDRSKTKSFLASLTGKGTASSPFAKGDEVDENGDRIPF